ncbi:hypothetical protein S245_047064, partial [Arachis hypogaea]
LAFPSPMADLLAVVKFSPIHNNKVRGTIVALGKCFLVTGPPGVGKNTLIIRVFESLKTFHLNLKLQGFYT